jgi:hypothetical protein
MSFTNEHQRTAHRGALALLASCAVLIAVSSLTTSQTSPEAAPRAPAPVFPYTAIALGVGAIACRQQAFSSARRERPAVGLSIASFALAAGIGVVGLALFWLEELVQPALLYTVGGALLALRGPPPMQASTGNDEAESQK